MRIHLPVGIVVLLGAGVVLGSCASTSPGGASGAPGATGAEDGSTSVTTAAATVPAGWTDEDVTFATESGTVHASYLHPASGSTKMPAALLIAGSGPTDRNGDSAAGGSFGTLRAVAGMLAADGVSSLRYDKLFSGRTGAGTVTDPTSVGLGTFEQQASAALVFLVGRPDVDTGRVTVVGHSEGGLFAELLGANRVPGAPPVHSIALLEPLARRYLDLVTAQITAQVGAAVGAGQMTSTAGKTLLDDLSGAVTAVRAGTPLPALPPQLAPLFAPANLTFLHQIDAVDPVALGGSVPVGMPVLLSCSDADIQVSCTDVRALSQAIAGSTLLAQHGVSHVLKVDASKTPAHYAADLPFSPELRTALSAFAVR